MSEVAANEVLPDNRTPASYAERTVELSRKRLTALAEQDKDWWLTTVLFFDVRRERIWIFWRRLLHTAHRAQLGVFLRLLNKTVPSTYVPTADVRWEELIQQLASRQQAESN